MSCYISTFLFILFWIWCWFTFFSLFFLFFLWFIFYFFFLFFFSFFFWFFFWFFLGCFTGFSSSVSGSAFFVSSCFGSSCDIWISDKFNLLTKEIPNEKILVSFTFSVNFVIGLSMILSIQMTKILSILVLELFLSLDVPLLGHTSSFLFLSS